ncbi:hypothetical protein ABTX24_27070 [Nocardioides sp. NPDC127514]|uniref:hypothetical protein n=1 Tax=unclassified Nocardioides TaxID=2615069 RepID=UPI00135AFAC2
MESAKAETTSEKRSNQRTVGGLRVSVPDDAFDPLPESEIVLWEGSLDEDETL